MRYKSPPPPLENEARSPESLGEMCRELMGYAVT